MGNKTSAPKPLTDEQRRRLEQRRALRRDLTAAGHDLQVMGVGYPENPITLTAPRNQSVEYYEAKFQHLLATQNYYLDYEYYPSDTRCVAFFPDFFEGCEYEDPMIMAQLSFTWIHANHLGLRVQLTGDRIPAGWLAHQLKERAVFLEEDRQMREILNRAASCYVHVRLTFPTFKYQYYLRQKYGKALEGFKSIHAYLGIPTLSFMYKPKEP